MYAIRSYYEKIAEQLALVKQLGERYDHGIGYKLAQCTSQLEPMQGRLQQTQMLLLNQKHSLLQSLQSNLQSQDPKLKDKKGFAQVVKAGRPVSLRELGKGDEIRLMDSRYTATAKVAHIRENAAEP